MYVANQQYTVDLSCVNKIRYLLFPILYSRQDCIETLKNIIFNNLECLSVDYIFNEYTFIIKIKKTAMRKLNKKSFAEDPRYYFTVVGNIFTEFINTYQNDIINSIKNYHYSVDESVLMYSILKDPKLMANLCHITCISDNTLCIKL